MKKVSSLVASYSTLVGLSSIFIGPATFVRAEQDELAPYFVAHPFYSDEYLNTLSEEEIDEALKLKMYSVDDAGLLIAQQDTGNGQLPHAFAPNDPRNAVYSPRPKAYKLTYGVKKNYCTSSNCDELSEGDQYEWFIKPFATWFDNANCNVPNPTFKVDLDSTKPGVVQNLFQTGILDYSLYEAEITSVGFFSPSEFIYFADNPDVLGVAFTYWWDGTDINLDGKFDSAFVEVYYNSAITWSIEPEVGKISFPWVATHEVGHALGLAHFGTISLLTKGNGDVTIKTAPKAIMNAFYNSQDPNTLDFKGIDTRPICYIYEAWIPN